LLGGVSVEVESTQLILHLALGLVVARGRGVTIGGVLLKVTEAVEEGALVSLGLLEELLYRHLVKTSLRLVLAGGVPVLVLALARVILVGGVLVLLWAVGYKVVRISTAIASFLRTTTMLMIQEVVVKPRKPTDDQHQLVVPKSLQLLLCDRHQRGQGKRHL
jgi:hypothetical protein